MGTSLGFIRNRGTTAAAGRRHQAGVMLLEVLIAILIFSIGVLAVIGMQAAAINNVNDSKYRSEAAFLTNQLLSQMWTDAGNLTTANYGYALGGSPGAKLGTPCATPTAGTWLASVCGLLPNASTVPPIVTITGTSAAGATVTIQVRWLMPEEASQSPLPPAHNYTVIATIFTS